MPAQADLTAAEAEQHEETASGQNEQGVVAVSTVAARQGMGEQDDSDVPSNLTSECHTSKLGCKEEAETRTNEDQEAPQAYQQQKEADKEEEEEEEQNENAFLEHVENVAAALAASD